MVPAEIPDFVSSYKLFRGPAPRSYLWGRNAKNSSVVKQSAPVCLPVDRITVIWRSKHKKSGNPCYCCCWNTNTNCICVSYIRHSIILSHKTKKYQFIQNRHHRYSFTLHSEFQNVDYGWRRLCNSN